MIGLLIDPTNIMPCCIQHFLILHFIIGTVHLISTHNKCKIHTCHYLSLESDLPKHRLYKNLNLFINIPKIQAKYSYIDTLVTLKGTNLSIKSNGINTSNGETILSNHIPLSTRNRLNATYDNYYLSNTIKNIKSDSKELNKLFTSTISQFHKLGNSLYKIISSVIYRTQVVSLIISYLIYNFYLSNLYMAFPFQLIPNNLGLFNSIGLDTLASITGMLYFIKTNDWDSFIEKMTKKTTKVWAYFI